MTVQEHMIWLPSRYIALWGDFGQPMYVLMTWLAIVAGAIWWTAASWKLTDAIWKRAAALVVIATVTIFFTRLFHILFWGWEQTIDHPRLLTQLRIGRSMHGSLAGFAVSAVIIARIWRAPLHQIAGILSPWPLFGLICARIGNFWNSETIGTQSDGPFAVGFYFSGDHGVVPRHPVQLYEATLTFLLLGIMLVIFLKKHSLYRPMYRPYLMPALAMTGYSIIRFCCDFIKVDPGYLFGTWLSTGQWLSLVYAIFGLLLLRQSRVKGESIFSTDVD